MTLGIVYCCNDIGYCILL